MIVMCMSVMLKSDDILLYTALYRHDRKLMFGSYMIILPIQGVRISDWKDSCALILWSMVRVLPQQNIHLE